MINNFCDQQSMPTSVVREILHDQYFISCFIRALCGIHLACVLVLAQTSRELSLNLVLWFGSSDLWTCHHIQSQFFPAGSSHKTRNKVS